MSRTARLEKRTILCSILDWTPREEADIGISLPGSPAHGDLRDIVANGVQNVWICEVGSSATNGSFEDFRERLVTSRIEVEINYDGSLGECLVDNHCLDNIFYFLECMAGVCAQNSNLLIQQCQDILPKEDPQALASCLAKSVRRSDVSVEYVWPGRRTLTFGWQEELKLDGVEVSLEGFDRYSNPFTKMDWGARQISVQAGGHNLDMEFSNFTINQD